MRTFKNDLSFLQHMIHHELFDRYIEQCEPQKKRAIKKERAYPILRIPKPVGIDSALSETYDRIANHEQEINRLIDSIPQFIPLINTQIHKEGAIIPFDTAKYLAQIINARTGSIYVALKKYIQQDNENEEEHERVQDAIRFMTLQEAIQGKYGSNIPLKFHKQQLPIKTILYYATDEGLERYLSNHITQQPTHLLFTR